MMNSAFIRIPTPIAWEVVLQMDQSQVAAPPKGRLWGRATQALPQPPPPLAVPSCGSQLMPPYFQFFSKTVLPPRTLPRELYRNKGKRAQKQTAAPSQKPPQPSDGKQAGLTSLKGTVFPSRADARLLSLSPRGGRGSR